LRGGKKDSADLDASTDNLDRDVHLSAFSESALSLMILNCDFIIKNTIILHGK
jgi:hypothetical protein